MAYERQLQEAMERLDQSLFKLRNIIKNGQVAEALQFMEQGELKERFGDLQSMIILSQTGDLGARGTTQTGAL